IIAIFGVVAATIYVATQIVVAATLCVATQIVAAQRKRRADERHSRCKAANVLKAVQSKSANASGNRNHCGIINHSGVWLLACGRPCSENSLSRKQEHRTASFVASLTARGILTLILEMRELRAH